MGQTFQLLYSDEALADLQTIRAFDRSTLLAAIQRRLAATPTAVSRSAVKRLRQPAPAEYRLRVGEYRVFYVVRSHTVQIRRILSKDASMRYLGEGS